MKTSFEFRPVYKVIIYFYGTENVIWAGLGLVGNTEKNNWGPIMSIF